MLIGPLRHLAAQQYTRGNVLTRFPSRPGSVSPKRRPGSSKETQRSSELLNAGSSFGTKTLRRKVAMRSRKPMFITLATIVVTAVVSFMFGCSRGMKATNQTNIVHAQGVDRSVKSTKTSATAPSLKKPKNSTKPMQPASCAVKLASNENSIRQENAADNTPPTSFPVVLVVVTVSSEPIHDPVYKSFRQQAERRNDRPGSGWHHFRPDLQSGQ